MFKFMLSEFFARFRPLGKRLGTSQDRNITQTKEVTLFPDYFFLCDYDEYYDSVTVFCSFFVFGHLVC